MESSSSAVVVGLWTPRWVAKSTDAHRSEGAGISIEGRGLDQVGSQSSCEMQACVTKTIEKMVKLFVSESLETTVYMYACECKCGWMQTEIYFTNLADLKMPVAIVTGGNKGIGLGVVRNIKCFF